MTARSDDPVRNRRRLHLSASRFTEHLSELTRRWQPVTLRELVDGLRAGKSLPSRAVVVTFDDGYRNVRTVAAPLLARFGVPFTLFVLTDLPGQRLWKDRLEAALLAAPDGRLEWRDLRLDLRDAVGRGRAASQIIRSLEQLGGERAEVLEEILERLGGEPGEADEDRDLLGWDEIRSLRSAGVEIGAHADRHERLTRRSEIDVTTALAGCRRSLEHELGPGPYPFCYPYGAWDPPRAAAVREAGFTCALTTDAGRNPPGQDLYSLRRLLVGADDDVARLRASLSGLRSFSRPGSP